jgi:hypothetical protein
MNSFMSIVALLLLAVLCWIVGHVVSLAILRLSDWPSRFQVEERFPPHRARKINRLVATAAGLVVAGIVMCFCAPASLRAAVGTLIADQPSSGTTSAPK